jgi:ADP-ribosylglycohydrolase
MAEQVFKASEGAIWGMLIADALAMPVHWYYNPDDIKHGYGSWLTGYVAPNKKHPSSILTLSAVGG